MSAKKILVVDDDEVLRRMVKSILEKEKFQVLQAADGWEGLEKANKEKPDLILLDIMMPEMKGLDVLRTLKANEATSSIPVIMLTVVGDSETVVQAIELKISGYLLKPFKRQDLLSKISQALNPQGEADSQTQVK